MRTQTGRKPKYKIRFGSFAWWLTVFACAAGLYIYYCCLCMICSFAG